MIDDMVMRSVYLRPREDDQLRELAHGLKVSKSDLIRSAISAKLIEWLAAGGTDVALHDLRLGLRSGSNARLTPVTAKAAAARRGPQAKAAKPVAAPAPQPRARPAKPAPAKAPAVKPVAAKAAPKAAIGVLEGVGD